MNPFVSVLGNCIVSFWGSKYCLIETASTGNVSLPVQSSGEEVISISFLYCSSTYDFDL